MKGWIFVLIVSQVATFILMGLALDFRMEQEKRICMLIAGADCSFIENPPKQK